MYDLDRSHPLLSEASFFFMPQTGYGSEVWYDLSGHARHATLTSMDASTDWVDDHPGWSPGRVLDFDGTNDTAVLTNPGSMDGGQCTLHWWVWPVSVAKSGHRREGIFYGDDGGSNYARFCHNGEADGEVNARWRNTAGGNYLSARTGTVSGFTAQQWNHVCVAIRGAADADVYVNGKVASWASISGSGTPATIDTDWKFGDSEANNRYLEGRIGPVALYDAVHGRSMVEMWYAETQRGLMGLRRVFVPASSGGSTVAGTATETLALSDVVSGAALFPATATETLALSDVASAVRMIPGSVSDIVALSDSLSSVAVFSAVITETLTVSDVVSALGAFVGAVTETLVVTDEASGSTGLKSHRVSTSPVLTPGTTVTATASLTGSTITVKIVSIE